MLLVFILPILSIPVNFLFPPQTDGLNRRTLPASERRLDRGGGGERNVLAPGPRDELHADGQAFGRSSGADDRAGPARHVVDHRVAEGELVVVVEGRAVR